MSIYDVNCRLAVLVKKYDKYDASFGKERTGKSDDPFMEEYEDLEMQIEALTHKAEEIAAEQNRAMAAAANAEIRKSKQELLSTGLEGLQKKLKKGKGVTKAIVEDRNEKMKKLIDMIYDIPDGMGGNKRAYKKGYALPGKGGSITLNAAGASAAISNNPLYYEHSDKTKAFEQEWDYARKQQDAKLDRIEKGVATLGDMARTMGEELDKQNPIITDIDQQMDKVASQLRNNNQRLKGLVHKMANTRNFCVDIILLCLLLGIGAYLYSMFAPK